MLKTFIEKTFGVPIKYRQQKMFWVILIKAFINLYSVQLNFAIKAD